MHEVSLSVQPESLSKHHFCTHPCFYHFIIYPHSNLRHTAHQLTHRRQKHFCKSVQDLLQVRARPRRRSNTPNSSSRRNAYRPNREIRMDISLTTPAASGKGSGFEVVSETQYRRHRGVSLPAQLVLSFRLDMYH